MDEQLALTPATSPKKTWLETLPTKVQVELRTAASRILVQASAYRFWERILNDVQRAQLGDDPSVLFEKPGGIIHVWRKLYGGSQPCAVVEIAYRLNHVDQSTRDWLLREVGEPLDTPKSPDIECLPNWQRENGQLCYDRVIVRRVRRMKVITGVESILDAFEAQGWPTSIPNPLPYDQQQLHQVLRSLNKGLQRLRFHAQGGAKFIYWQLHKLPVESQ